MSKQTKDIETEELIKKTAKRLFFGEGKFNATTQEIADSAGVNRTLINYYFRSRDNLFNLIFEDAVKREEKLREKVLFSDLPFKEKIEMYIDDSLLQAKDYPYLETYIVSRINDGCFYKEEDEWEKFMKRFYEEFENEVKKGTVERMEPLQFILNIASLVSFPVAIRPLFQSTMRISDAEYDRILSDRKEIIMKILFKN
ncbi:TetR/AcrR family transcriptional regulator [Moheibacter sp.]|uniref:TetR/AcrR family transcriptional regulator n=1 Tax=Moheibacter sp. TaxID=1965316 RepID=UPI003C7287C3